MKKFIKLLIPIGLACATILISSHVSKASPTAPVSATDYTEIRLPTNVLTIAGGTTTNVIQGWTNVVTTTNITQSWNSTNAAFVYTTNTVSVTNTYYADFSAVGKSKVPIQIEMTNTVAGTSNMIFGVCKSITGGNFDTNNITWCTNAATGTALSVGSFSIDMTGYNYGRIYSFQNQDTNTAHSMQINFLGASNKKN